MQKKGDQMLASSVEEMKEDIEKAAWQERIILDESSSAFYELLGMPLIITDVKWFTIETQQKVYSFPQECLIVEKDCDFNNQDSICYYVTNVLDKFQLCITLFK